MGKKKVIAIDVKEIAKPKIESLGLILLEMIPKLNDYNLLLLSDVAIPKKLYHQMLRLWYEMFHIVVEVI